MHVLNQKSKNVMSSNRGIARNNKILVCDDDVSTPLIIKNLLNEYSMQELDIAKSGREAIKMINLNTYCLIIISDKMPYYSGLAIIEYLRKVKKSNVPILVITETDFEENLHHALRLGANDFISKPFNPDELKFRINKYIDYDP